MHTHRNLDKAVAEEVAVAALAFLAADTERLGGFLAATGLGPETIRRAAREPGFLGAVLDYLAADESLLLMFAANRGLDPALVARAHALLGSGHPAG
ncbi:DUF3572 domain-containing protein [Chelatococcus sp. SYSU_G07232]|uniref:DUF3572 domain-containing protein n=1 Tax=Chelatococcus albus TaxID=3047466 RepID=A0ABT7ACU8_9HYPH|nr:DUF3572 domain-containing protein [Chelatococcus sp. SYSU_G07232]MDJ1157203.1 DUF3572 domain-containing protein [Chelatococcus sp. SYSU_G07232]